MILLKMQQLNTEKQRYQEPTLTTLKLLDISSKLMRPYPDVDPIEDAQSYDEAGGGWTMYPGVSHGQVVVVLQLDR